MSIDGMVTQAEKSIGLGEPNYIQSWYNSRMAVTLGRNFAWCNAAITYWAWHSDNQAAVTFNGYYAYTVAHAQRFKDLGQWHYGTAGIRRGDIVFFDWAGRDAIGAIDHVGLVTSVSGGHVYTIEGNTANVCARRVRGAYEIAGYGRPNYLGAAPKPKPAPAKKAPAKKAPAKPWVWSNVGPGQTNNSVKIVQKALVKAGHKIAAGATGHWGAQTTAAYAAWQRSLGYSGADADGVPGPASLKKLAAKGGFDIHAA